MSCAPLNCTSLFGTFGLFDDSKPGCDNAESLSLGKPKFYGKNAKTGLPLFVAMDYQNFQIARTGMTIASGLAVVLGVAVVVLGIKLAKKD